MTYNEKDKLIFSKPEENITTRLKLIGKVQVSYT